MKNFITYYYNIIIDQLKKIDSKYEFIINNEKYIFMPFLGDIEKLNKIYSFLKQRNMYCHEIIINKDNSFITYNNNIPYILIKNNILSKNFISLNELLIYDVPLYYTKKLNWKKNWEEKIDYYEYQMSEFGFKYRKLRECFNYYVGLCETSISLLNYLSKDEISCNIQHKKINYNESIEDFYNPINIIEDIYVRDIAEYIKSNYLENILSQLEVINIIKNINFSRDEAIIFLSRLLYPNYFFDLYDRIIKDEIKEERINTCKEKSAQYETLLKNINIYLINKYNIPSIDWLKN